MNMTSSSYNGYQSSTSSTFRLGYCYYCCLLYVTLTLTLLATTTTLFQGASASSLPTTTSTDDSKIRPKPKPEQSSHWHRSAQNSITQKLHQHQQLSLQGKAKNLILYLGDGMSLSTVTATRIYKGQLEGLPFGEEAKLHMDTFPFVGTSKTYCSDAQIADSACSATAYLCGSKSNYKTIGVSPTVKFNNCSAQIDTGNHVSSILAWAQSVGMSTGIVTTTTVTHASPAGAYAHTANRDWENNRKVKDAKQDDIICDDIAEQLVHGETGRKINVILGGGREHFFNATQLDLETGMAGGRDDGKNLVQEWVDNHVGEGYNAKYVTTRDQLLALDIGNAVGETEYLLGLFAPLHVNYADDQEMGNDPSLAEMTRVAIQILRKNPKGFFLFVEGGRIDHAHHENLGRRALAETLQFDDAIKIGDDLTFDSETLIVVTSDHSHLFSISGDAVRGNPILGFSSSKGSDGLPYTTLGYLNGKRGYRNQSATLACSNNSQSQTFQSYPHRVDITHDNVYDLNYTQVAYVPMEKKAKHAGEDVLIFAKGPWAHLFSGVNDQSFIPHAMAYAGCIKAPSAIATGKFCALDGNGAGATAGAGNIGVKPKPVPVVIAGTAGCNSGSAASSKLSLSREHVILNSVLVFLSLCGTLFKYFY